MRLTHAPILLVLALSACARSDDPELQQPTPAPPTPATPTAAVATATPSPKPAAPPPKTPEPPVVADPGAVAIAKDAPKFTPVATNPKGSTHTSLLRTTDGQVFAATGPQLMRLSPDGAIEIQGAWTRGVDDSGPEFDAVSAGMYWWTASAMGGTWPDGAYLVLQPEFGSRGPATPAELYRRTNAMWNLVETRAKKFGWAPIAFGPWKESSLLALKGFTPLYTTGDDEREATPAEQKSVAAVIAKQKRLIVLRGRPKAPAFASDIRGFASLASGHIFAAVAEGERVAMLHYDDATQVARTLPLPAEVAVFEVEVHATAPDRAWVFGQRAEEETRGYVARFDGVAWREVDVPCKGGARSGSIDDTGAAYFVCEVPRGASQGGALLRVKDGIVEELPTGIEPWQAIATSPTDIWAITMPFSGPATLVHTGTTLAKPELLPDALAAATAVFEWADPHPIDKFCDAPWFPLAAGADRAAVAKIVDAAEGGDDGYPELFDARVQGRVEVGVTLHSVGRNVKRAVKRWTARLGALAGPPTCNQRPPVAGE